MAHPFGGHPTLDRFVAFAKEQGCKAELFANTTADGRAYSVLRLENPSGSWVSIVNPELTEYLAPSTVTYYQRRLGIKSHFGAMPEQSTDNPD